MVMTMQVRLPWGIHGLTKLLLRPVIPYPSTPCGQPSLKWPYSRFRNGRPQGGQPGAVLLLLRPAIPYPSTPCGQPPLKRPYSRFTKGDKEDEDGDDDAAPSSMGYPWTH
jgi:hypothetical protein